MRCLQSSLLSIYLCSETQANPNVIVTLRSHSKADEFVPWIKTVTDCAAFFFFISGLAWTRWKLKACVPSVPTILLWLWLDWTVTGSGTAGLLKSLWSGLPWQNLRAGQDHIQAVCHVYPGHCVFCHSSCSSRQDDSESLEQHTGVSNIWSLAMKTDQASTQWFNSGLSHHHCQLWSP